MVGAPSGRGRLSRACGAPAGTPWQVVPPGAGGIPVLGAPAPLARHVSERPLLAASMKLPGLSLSLLA